MALMGAREEENRERIRSCMDDFDPNIEADHTWGVYKPDARPHWKVYRNRGNALSCLKYGWPGVIYQRGYDGRWAEVTRVNPELRDNAYGDSNCQACGHRIKDSAWYRTSQFIWIGKPTLHLASCCTKCCDRLNSYKIDDRSI